MKRIILAVMIMILALPCAALAEFSSDSSVYDPELAQRALSIAELAGTPDMLDGILKLEGYRQVGAYNYERPTGDTRHVVSYAMHDKALEDGRTAVIISIRGTAADEWGLNFDLMPSGDYELGYAENFVLAAEDIITENAAYFDALENPEFLLTGFSRGAAAANILGARLSDRFGGENVFCYTFATPRTVRGDYPEYPNIFNVINPCDIVTYMPLPAWGFERYGVDMVLPIDGADQKTVSAVKAVYRVRPDKSGAFYNPEEGSAPVMSLIDTMGQLVPDIERGFSEVHAYGHTGLVNDGEDGMSMLTFCSLFFTGGLFKGQPTPMQLVTQAENDFTPLISLMATGKGMASLAGTWYYAHNPGLYGAWMTVTLE